MHRAEGWAVLIVVAVGAGFLIYAAAHAVGQVLASQSSGGGYGNSLSGPAVDTSGWLDYHNDQYNFDFEYPSDWQLSTSGLANNAPFVAVGNPLNGTSTYTLEVFIENDTSSLSSGEFVHQMLAADRAQDAVNAKSGPTPRLTPQYTGTEILLVGQPTTPGGLAPYEAYELESVYEFDHNADQIYVADGNIILRFDFPVAEENPNISLPVANNAIAQRIVGTLRFGE